MGNLFPLSIRRASSPPLFSLFPPSRVSFSWWTPMTASVSRKRATSSRRWCASIAPGVGLDGKWRARHTCADHSPCCPTLAVGGRAARRSCSGLCQQAGIQRFLLEFRSAPTPTPPKPLFLVCHAAHTVCAHHLPHRICPTP